MQIESTVEVHFSPNGGCREAVMSQLRDARSTVDIAIYTFTSPEIAALLDSVHDRGVNVRIVMDRSQAAGQYSMFGSLLADGIPARIGAGRGLMHDKFAVIDDSITLTGSYNWTEAAETRNDENLLVISSGALAEAFEGQFEYLWSAAAPSQAGPAGSVQTKSSARPNDTVYVTKTGKKYHRAGCSSLSKSCIPMTKSEAEVKGYTPCSKCKP
jgi:phosphatidylserine/phosphatidylglycerophosphate/cardiolipin synthase-like enzyme